MTPPPLRGREIDLSHPPSGWEPGELLLTFDDGPHEYTPQIMATLAEHDLRAVFFMIGANAAANPEIAKAVLAAGHVVGSHTANHAHLPQLTAAGAEAEVVDGHAMVTAALAPAVPQALFRFPFLATTPELKGMVRRVGLKAVGINVDTRDWEEQPAQRLLEGAVARIEKVGSGIVLMHDIQQRTTIMLPHLLRILQHRGFRVVTPVMSA